MPEGGGISAIGLDWKLLLSQIFNFLILVIILGKFLYKPIIKLLDERSAQVKKNEELTEKLKASQVDLDQKQQEILAKSQKEALNILENSKKEAAAIIKTAQGEAARKSEEQIAKTKAEIAFEKEKMWQNLRKDLVYLVIKTSEKLIREKIDPRLAKKFSEQSIREIEEVL